MKFLSYPYIPNNRGEHVLFLDLRLLSKPESHQMVLRLLKTAKAWFIYHYFEFTAVPRPCLDIIVAE